MSAAGLSARAVEARAQCFAILGIQPDPARRWWNAASPAQRLKVCARLGVFEASRTAWDALQEYERAKIRPIAERAYKASGGALAGAQ